MKIGGAVVPLDDGNRSTWPEEPPQRTQGLDRTGKVLQDEADKDVVEGFRVERQGEEIRLLELNIGETSRIRRGLCFRDGVRGDVDRGNSCARAVAGERYTVTSEGFRFSFC